MNDAASDARPGAAGALAQLGAVGLWLGLSLSSSACGGQATAGGPPAAEGAIASRSDQVAPYFVDAVDGADNADADAAGNDRDSDDDIDIDSDTDIDSDDVVSARAYDNGSDDTDDDDDADADADADEDTEDDVRAAPGSPGGVDDETQHEGAEEVLLEGEQDDVGAAGVGERPEQSFAREADVAEAVDWLAQEAQGQHVDELTAEARPVDELDAEDERLHANPISDADPDDADDVADDTEDADVDNGPLEVFARERAGPRYFDNEDHRHKPRLLACLGASSYFVALTRRYDVLGRCGFEEAKQARRHYGRAARARCTAPTFLGCRYQNGVERYFYGYTRELLRPERDVERASAEVPGTQAAAGGRHGDRGASR